MKRQKDKLVENKVNSGCIEIVSELFGINPKKLHFAISYNGANTQESLALFIAEELGCTQEEANKALEICLDNSWRNNKGLNYNDMIEQKRVMIASETGLYFASSGEVRRDSLYQFSESGESSHLEKIADAIIHFSKDFTRYVDETAKTLGIRIFEEYRDLIDDYALSLLDLTQETKFNKIANAIKLQEIWKILGLNSATLSIYILKLDLNEDKEELASIIVRLLGCDKKDAFDILSICLNSIRVFIELPKDEHKFWVDARDPQTRVLLTDVGINDIHDLIRLKIKNKLGIEIKNFTNEAEKHDKPLVKDDEGNKINYSIIFNNIEVITVAKTLGIIIFDEYRHLIYNYALSLTNLTQEMKFNKIANAIELQEIWKILGLNSVALNSSIFILNLKEHKKQLSAIFAVQLGCSQEDAYEILSICSNSARNFVELQKDEHKFLVDARDPQTRVLLTDGGIKDIHNLIRLKIKNKLGIEIETPTTRRPDKIIKF